jgi:hypothetical protein
MNRHYNYLIGKRVRICKRIGSNGEATESEILGATGVLVRHDRDILDIRLDDETLAERINYGAGPICGFALNITYLESTEDDCPKCSVKCNWQHLQLKCPECGAVIAG